MKSVIVTIFAALLLGGILVIALRKEESPAYVSHARILQPYQLVRPGEGIPTPRDEILSMKFLLEVVDRIGPARILDADASEANGKEAAILLRDNLKVTPAKSKNIWNVEFRHRKSEVCKQVLNDILVLYYRPYFKDGIGPSITITKEPSEPRRVR
jgi:hypothetical protein